MLLKSYVFGMLMVSVVDLTLKAEQPKAVLLCFLASLSFWVEKPLTFTETSVTFTYILPGHVESAHTGQAKTYFERLIA